MGESKIQTLYLEEVLDAMNKLYTEKGRDILRGIFFGVNSLPHYEEQEYYRKKALLSIIGADIARKMKSFQEARILRRATYENYEIGGLFDEAYAYAKKKRDYERVKVYNPIARCLGQLITSEN